MNLFDDFNDDFNDDDDECEYEEEVEDEIFEDENDVIGVEDICLILVFKSEL